jgi:enoyl-[acyl-carrier protein] reductase III
MASPLQGKIALVTGASRGIGRAIARRLAQAGCDVALHYFNSSDEAEKLAAELKATGVRTCTIQGNLTDGESTKGVVDEFRKHFDRLDILVNNAASGVLKPALEMTLKHWRWCMETNALSLNVLVQQARPLFKPGSRVLVLSSIGSHRAIPNYAFIGASKAALESLVRSLSLELAPLGVSVNTISAGVVDTDALKYFPNREALLEHYKSKSLAGRELKPEDVANVAYLLCLPEAEMIKGQTIFVDAGYSIVG